MYSDESKNIAQFKQWIEEAPEGGVVFFGGAGVSTESGIPDFRSQDGLYNQKYKYPPEQIISHSFFMQDTPGFYEFYCDRMLFPDAEPNAAHIALAKLEAQGKLDCVITQNIDGLHQKAGSKTVHELHGSVLRNYCMNCHKFYDDRELVERYKQSKDMIPRCDCGGIIKPDVVLYEESLDEKVLNDSVLAIEQADVLIIAGTSLVVWPAAGLVNYFHGRHLVIINLSATSSDRRAQLCITEKVGEVLGAVVE